MVLLVTLERAALVPDSRSVDGKGITTVGDGERVHGQRLAAVENQRIIAATVSVNGDFGVVGTAVNRQRLIDRGQSRAKCEGAHIGGRTRARPFGISKVIVSAPLSASPH